jgi:hypothetical protein
MKQSVMKQPTVSLKLNKIKKPKIAISNLWLLNEKTSYHELHGRIKFDLNKPAFFRQLT